MDTGTTAFMLCCIIGLTMMIPGLALFYGGMVSVKSSTNMMMMTFGAVAVVGVLWVLFGFSMTFGTSYGGFVGSFTEFAGMKNLTEPMTTINGLPVSLFALFQALFAAITVALISGAAADRMKFGAWMTFATAWAILVYFPVAHWVFAFDGVVTPDSKGGWIANQLKAIDFAGGTAVHINSGAAALAVAIVLGKSLGFGKFRKPHNVPLTLLGAGLLVRVQRRLGTGRGHLGRHRHGYDVHRHLRGDAGVARGREGQGRARDRCRRRLGCRRGPRRHHPGLRRSHPGRLDLPRLDRRRDLPACCRAEVEVRL
jgi:ammonia channel protein AmtB